MTRASVQYYPRFQGMIFSVISWMVVSVMTVLLFILGLVLGFLPTLLFDRRRRCIMSWVARTWAKSCILINPVCSFRVEGTENLKPGKQYVIVANHQSILDILVVLAGLNLPFKFIAKKELFAIPFLGWHMTLAGYIPLNRGNRESAREAMLQARDFLKRGASLLFFPEGTRSEDGEIREFKSGAFRVAADEGVELLPVLIEGTGDVAPKHSWYVKKKARIELFIGKPVAAPKNDPASIDEVRLRIRNQLKQQLAELRSQPETVQ